MKCPTCNGKGEVYSANHGSKTCPRCLGTKFVKTPKKK